MLDGMTSAMTDGREYDALADVYAWLVPDEVFGPRASVAAFSSVTDLLEPGARVLDCACGVGDLAVGLAENGFRVSATDASAQMVEHTQARAGRHGITVDAAVCDWVNLPGRFAAGAFDAVLCVGNSLHHAEGRSARRASLAGQAAVLRPGGVLAVTSRNWELVRQTAPRLEVVDRVVVRDGRPAVVVYAWTVPDAWADVHIADVAVALLGEDGAVDSRTQALPFWPSTHTDLDDDLRAAGLDPIASTYDPAAPRYLVTARRE